MRRALSAKLLCPRDHAELTLNTDERTTVVLSGQLACRKVTSHVFEIRDGIPDFRDSVFDHVARDQDPELGTFVTKSVARTLARIPSEWTLDAGCGRGAYAPYVEGRYVGVDIVRPFLIDAQRRWPQGDFVAADIQSLPFRSKAFDLTISSQVLEHFDQEGLRRVIAELWRVTDGSVVVDTPNESPFMHRLRGMVFPEVHRDHASPLAHRSALNARILREYGFHVEGCIGHVTRTRFPAPRVWDVFDAIARRFPAIGGNLIGVARVSSEQVEASRDSGL